MKNFARIENGKVAERLDVNALPPFHPSLHWAECPAETQEGWFFDGATFSAPPPPSAEHILATLTGAVQAHLDAAAAAVGYDSIYTACTYADEPSVPRFQAEGRALRAWRSEVWAACHAIMTKVQSGQRDVPTAAALIAELPALVLP